MVDERQPATDADSLDEAGDDAGTDGERLTQAVRRERLAELAEKVGDHAQQDGDVVVVEAGEPVVLHLELNRDGLYTATWWATALTQNAHHRWREAAAELLQAGESIHTSALGGGYLIEIERTTRDEAELLNWASDSTPVDRVRDLLAAFPDAVGQLPEEPVPDYLLPPEPELPPLGEVDEDDVNRDDDEVEGD